MVNTSNPSYAVDSMIYGALASIDLQNTYFSAYNNPKDDSEISNLRDEYRLARHTILNKRVGYWCLKEIDLVEEVDKPGFYRAPADLIAWVRPIPILTTVSQKGVRLYKLPSKSIVYIFDPEDLAGLPIEIITDIRDFFLLRLSSRGKISTSKMQLIRAQAMASDENAKELCSIVNASKQFMNIQSRGSRYGY